MALPVMRPVEIAAHELESPSASVLSRLEAGFGDCGLGIIVITDADAADAAEGALVQAAEWAAEPTPAAAGAAIKAAGLGTDVPAKTSALTPKKGPPARPAPVGNTLAATLQLDWRSGATAPADEPRASLHALGMRLVHVMALVADRCDDLLAQRRSSGGGSGTAADSPSGGVATSASAGGDGGSGGGGIGRILRGSGTAKARLIHYYNAEQTGLPCRRSGSAAATEADGNGDSAGAAASSSVTTTAATGARLPTLPSLATWQGWHSDYGLLTALVPPRYECMVGGVDAAAAAAGTTRRAVLPAGDALRAQAGLVVLAPAAAVAEAAGGLSAIPPPSVAAGAGTGTGISGHVPVLIDIPPGAIAVQIGDAAQILSGGRLVATPHCVARPACAYAEDDDSSAAAVPHHHHHSDTAAAAAAATSSPACARCGWSRQMFVVFATPGWSTPMTPLLLHHGHHDASGAEGGAAAGPKADSDAPVAAAGLCRAAQCRAAIAASAGAEAALAGLVPPLAARWACGASFANFGRATTSHFYGKKGVQAQAQPAEGQRAVK